MSGFYKLLNLVLAVVVFYLLFQSFETRSRLDDIGVPSEGTPETSAEAPSWDDPDLQKPYPKDIPEQVINLIEAFEPLDGQYDQKRITKVIKEIDDKNLKDTLSSIDWQSEAGTALANEFIKRKILAPEQLQRLETMDFKNLETIRYCLSDPLCYPLFEKCCLNIKCCIHRYPCGWPCKACYSCWHSCCGTCCTNTVQVGIKEGTTGTFITAKKIEFSNVFKVTQDGTKAIVELREGTAADPMTQDDVQALIDHANNVGSNPATKNPHGIVKSDILNLNSNDTNPANIPNLITEADIYDGTITADDLGTDSVDFDEIKANAVRNEEIQNDAVNSAKIEDGTVTVDDLGTDSVDFDEIKTDAVRTEEIQNGTITKDDLTNINADKITWDKINADSGYISANHNLHVYRLTTDSVYTGFNPVAANSDLSDKDLSTSLSFGSPQNDMKVSLKVDGQYADYIYIYTAAPISESDFTDWKFFKSSDGNTYTGGPWTTVLGFSTPVYEPAFSRFRIQVYQPATSETYLGVSFDYNGSGTVDFTEVTAEREIHHTH